MNELQLRLIAGTGLMGLTLIHVLLTNPPWWVPVVAGLIGTLYYFSKLFFAFRYPLQLVLWLFEVMIVVGITYGALIAWQLL